eukprot:TRINITY_DN14688_c0_g1_i1.p1 TRINITY_DN14688_c0_g1~~TRINITY_DN14688_c0_g1_i1.p1  ORF type:complete len:264 (-),score=88.43 TRINITY_DN14688_c0_g1_i1:272-967(-)
MFVLQALLSFGGMIAVLWLYTTANDGLGDTGAYLSAGALLTTILLVSRNRLRDVAFSGALLALALVKQQILPAAPVSFYAAWCMLESFRRERVDDALVEMSEEEKNIRALLLHHGKSNELHLVDTWLVEYAGREAELYTSLSSRYRAERHMPGSSPEAVADAITQPGSPEGQQRSPPVTVTARRRFSGARARSDAVETARVQALLEQEKNIIARIEKLRERTQRHSLPARG